VWPLASRLSSDLIQIEETLITILPQFLRQTTILIGGIALIAVTSLQLTGILLLSLPVLTAAAVVFGRKTRKISREAQDRLADTATIVEETLQGIVSVKAFANEGYELNRHHAGLGRFLTSTLRAARLRSAFIAFIVFALFGGIVLVSTHSSTGCRNVRLVNLTQALVSRRSVVVTKSRLRNGNWPRHNPVIAAWLICWLNIKPQLGRCA
jgi:ABC-type multidrug transport system fused ATPase/permease subunit